jgi:hypothetical protein
MEEVKGMQCDLVVQLWSNHACVRPALQVGVRRRRHLNESAVASPNDHETLMRCNQLGKEESGSSLPLSGTLEIPFVRPAGAHSAELAQPPVSQAPQAV